MTLKDKKNIAEKFRDVMDRHFEYTGVQYDIQYDTGSTFSYTLKSEKFKIRQILTDGMLDTKARLDVILKEDININIDKLRSEKAHYYIEKMEKSALEYKEENLSFEFYYNRYTYTIDVTVLDDTTKKIIDTCKNDIFVSLDNKNNINSKIRAMFRNSFENVKNIRFKNLVGDDINQFINETFNKSADIKIYSDLYSFKDQTFIIRLDDNRSSIRTLTYSIDDFKNGIFDDEFNGFVDYCKKYISVSIVGNHKKLIIDLSDRLELLEKKFEMFTSEEEII